MKTLAFKIVLFCVIVAAAIFVMIENPRFFEKENVEALADEAGIDLATSFLLVACLATIIGIPRTIVTGVGGVLFGPLYGAFLGTLAATIVATLGFYLARYFFHDLVRTKFEPRYPLVSRRLRESSLSIMVLLRLCPIAPFTPVTYLAGASPANFPKYLIGTIIGMIPGAFLYAALGSQIENPETVSIVITVSLLALFLVLSYLWYRSLERDWEARDANIVL
ncbi:MAG: TVP38/TMEM64 family protein [Planctomycetes bacterium]|nr:TVP38/TMEM64 family protein [Planctomycetota bacterium]